MKNLVLVGLVGLTLSSMASASVNLKVTCTETSVKSPKDSILLFDNFLNNSRLKIISSHKGETYSLIPYVAGMACTLEKIVHVTSSGTRRGFARTEGPSQDQCQKKEFEQTQIYCQNLESSQFTGSSQNQYQSLTQTLDQDQTQDQCQDLRLELQNLFQDQCQEQGQLQTNQASSTTPFLSPSQPFSGIIVVLHKNFHLGFQHHHHIFLEEGETGQLNFTYHPGIFGPLTLVSCSVTYLNNY